MRGTPSPNSWGRVVSAAGSTEATGEGLWRVRPGAFVAANKTTNNSQFDLVDEHSDCDNNVWLRNIWSGAVSPECVKFGGHAVAP